MSISDLSSTCALPISEAADRGIAHDLRQLLEQRRVPGLLAHQLHRLLGAVAAGRALAAGLVLEEAHEVEGRGLQVVLVGEDHHGVRADEAVDFLELAEFQRDRKSQSLNSSN